MRVTTLAAAPVGDAKDSPIGTNDTIGSRPGGTVLWACWGVSQEDRTLADFYLEVGCNYRALIPGRDAHLLGAGPTYTNVFGGPRRLGREPTESTPLAKHCRTTRRS